jgi:hypothetical protein
MTSKILVHRLILLIQVWLEHRKRMPDISSNKKVESACCYFYHRTLLVVRMCHKSKQQRQQYRKPPATNRVTMSQQSVSSFSTAAPPVTEVGQELQEIRDTRWFAEKCDSWKNRIRGNTGKRFFKMIQFITKDEQERYGSRWQRLVCNDAEIPTEHRQAFWDKHGGKAAARKAINVRRMNIQNQIKKIFQGKWCVPSSGRVGIL